jgi:hypothetical protein
MAKQQQYRLKANTRFGAADEIVTEDHLKRSGADFDDLKARDLMEPVRAGEGDEDEGRVTDEDNKLRIEQRLKEESTRLGRPLAEHEKVNIEREVTKASAAQTQAAQKDDASDQKAANKGAGDGTKPPKAAR